MGQQEIYDLLKKNKTRWFTTKDISKQIDVSIGSITSCVKKMRISNFLNFKEEPRKRKTFLYSFKR